MDNIRLFKFASVKLLFYRKIKFNWAWDGEKRLR